MDEETYIKLLLAEKNFKLFAANEIVIEHYGELAIIQKWPDATRKLLQIHVCIN
ncbi:MAG TPA: hypothetical protein VMV47_11370 [Bacteroidales bacterium]|nr:hypothetical protein [Bacteroidales bacterium]